MGTTLLQWQQFTAGNPPEGTLPPVILESWQRCRSAHFDPAGEDAGTGIPDSQLQNRLRTSSRLLAVGRSHLGLASACLAGVHHALLLTDRDGIILEVAGNQPNPDALGAVPGQDWSERCRGTNGAGTALVADRPVIVLGPEHFRQNLHQWACAGAPIHDARGKIIGAVNLVTAVAEGGLHRMEMILYVARVIGRELDERSSIRLDHFLDQLAHELRNPLEPLINSLHILRLSGRDQAAGAEARDLAERQVHLLARLVEDLLTIGRIARGNFELHKERVILGRIIDEALGAARPLLDARHHQVAVLLPPEQVVVEADPMMLVRVVTALLLNAARNTEAGGHVWVTVEREDGDVLLSIRDTGTGLPADLLPRIFDLCPPREQGTSTRLGIGLNLARSLVELHGGSITALSDGPGEGSEVVIRFPAPTDAGPKAGRNGSHARSAQISRTLRVLVVDDDIDGARSISKLLQLWNHEVQVAHEGLTALELARAWKPEVVLLDIGLPGGLDGYEVARRLRNEFKLDRAVLIALTGWGQEEDRQRSRQAGFNYHLVKPANPETLQQLLSRASGHSPPKAAEE